MADYTIRISPAAQARLQTLVDRLNRQRNLNLTLLDWLQLNVEEIAIAEELAATTEALRALHQRQDEDRLAEAVEAERRRLLGEIRGPGA